MVAEEPRFPVSITGLGTALPRYIVPQQVVADRVIESLTDARLRQFARWLFRRSGIEARPFVIPDALGGHVASLYENGRPTLGERMSVYREEAPPLAEAAARRALTEARVEPSSITHLVVVTSTGAYTPGPDTELVSRLGLSPTVERTLVTMMGCSGAFHGIRVARRAVEARSSGVALVVCVELCSIHMDPQCDPGRIVAYTLFGDAAAAAVIRSDAAASEALVTLGRDATWLERRYHAELQWRLGDRGFELHLGRSLPSAIEETVPGFVQPLLADAVGSSDSSRVDWWAVHPGGAAILNKTRDSLGLKPDSLTTSHDVLRTSGNLSSASILFVLQRELTSAREGESGIVLGFGPGLTLEAIHAVRGGREAVGARFRSRSLQPGDLPAFPHPS